ncbi:hypothetical protein BGZ99_004982 [Dissophora globulifera]|uniref:HIG1 domain-containing protein n=1 Tax=Dissophora globulifera TaxID=979702 RepID=A0A9P6UUB7_9FUNG|nr:hypothetical protein BGZ99_004982 [Dissophora globulifera]
MSSTEQYYYDEEGETAMEKVKRLFKEHKVVAAGTFSDASFTLSLSCVGLTIGAFIGASWSVRTGRRELAQYMFRARVGFQFFTLAALLGGGMYYDKKRKEENLLLPAQQQLRIELEDETKNV